MGKNNLKQNKKHIALRTILICIGGIFIAWFALPLFVDVKLNIGIVTGEIVALVLLLYGIFFKYVNRFIAWLWKFVAGKIIEIIIGICLLGILSMVVATTSCMIYACVGPRAHVDREGQYASNAEDVTVLVLGCRIRGNIPSKMLVYRLNTAYEFLNNNDGAVCIVSGGKGAGETDSEANVMKEWLVQKGIEEDRIICEEKSTDTNENLIYSKKLIPQNCDVIIVTSDFHTYRAYFYALKNDIYSYTLPAKTPWYLFPTYFVREMYGIMEGWFLT